MARSARNGYIDVIKFILAMIVLEFHLNSGIFPGGRIAVEGFFMISSYLMMGYIERDKNPGDSLGVSTVRFMAHKYKGLFPFLLPSVIIGSVIYALLYGRTLSVYLAQLPLLLFDLFPLKEAGFAGSYPVGISWYLSAMFLSLAILYPLCRKFRSNFTLTVCPLLAVLIYGFLSHTYGHIAVASVYIDGVVVNAGLLRGLAGSALGCLLYEICKRLCGKQPTKCGRAIFSAAEICGFAYLVYAMHCHPKSQYDYVLVFLIFGMLVIGISGLSVSALLLNPRWTKPLATLSTLIVLNHCCWRDYLPKLLGSGYVSSNQVWIYYAAVACSCAAAYLLGKAVTFLMQKIALVRIFSE